MESSTIRCPGNVRERGMVHVEDGGLFPASEEVSLIIELAGGSFEVCRGSGTSPKWTDLCSAGMRLAEGAVTAFWTWEDLCQAPGA